MSLEFSTGQIARNDELDNAMYQFLLVLTEKNESEFPWDMYHIGDALDAVVDVMTSHGFDIHRPYIEIDGEDEAIFDYEKAKGDDD